LPTGFQPVFTKNLLLSLRHQVQNIGRINITVFPVAPKVQNVNNPVPMYIGIFRGLKYAKQKGASTKVAKREAVPRTANQE
jgi:hypothetical protein